MSGKARVSAIIVAAGEGLRMGGVSKPLIKLGGKAVITLVAEAFSECESVDEIVIVTKREEDYDGLLPKNKKIIFAPGGESRLISISNGVSLSSGEIVCLHDCARPFVTPFIIEAVISAARSYGVASAFCGAKDTLRYRDEKEGCIYTPKRENMLAVQTPQAFRRDIYFALRAVSQKKLLPGLDEAGMAEEAGFRVEYVENSSLNIKLTDAGDVKVAKAIAFLWERGEISFEDWPRL